MNTEKVIATEVKTNKFRIVAVMRDGQEIVLTKAGKFYDTVWVYVYPEDGSEFYTFGKNPASNCAQWCVGSLSIEAA